MPSDVRIAFLSSTGRDLHDHREAAYKVIERLQGWHCVRMEDFSSIDSRPLDFCFKMIKECDLFIGLIGHYYGSRMQPPHHIHSFTEYEYEEAVDLKKLRLMLIAADNLPIPANLHEDDESLQRQQEFRRQVRKERLARFFTSPDDLATSVSSSIFNLFKGNIAKCNNAITLFDVPFRQNPFFIGREDTLEKVREMLSNKGTAIVLQVASIIGMVALVRPK